MTLAGRLPGGRRRGSPMATARREIRAHSDDGGLCAICGSAFPCPRAELAEFTLGSLAPAARSPQPRHHASAHCWTFPGTADQVRRARRLLADVLDGCPVADDVILCLSELATNAILHSASAMRRHVHRPLRDPPRRVRAPACGR
ncbi:MAG TPA: hypothetical protein VNF47_17140 [Streptosporangiaceae bacterium]|nr:hypothetical protein [Streptosporangiaceae bacterium]